MENVKLTIVLDKDLDMKVRTEAVRQRTTLSAIAVEAFQQYFAARDAISDDESGSGRSSTNEARMEFIGGVA